MVDFGYDISNHKTIDPIFGTMDDFDELLEDLHSRGEYLKSTFHNIMILYGFLKWRALLRYVFKVESPSEIRL